MLVVTFSTKIMQTIQETAINEKTRELCQSIVDQPNFQSARQRIETFIADDKARAQYEGLMAKGQVLQQKQQRSEQLTAQEISEFEMEREALLKNTVARGFLEAQEEMHQIQHSINQQISKTLELGRIPTEADFEEEGGGCGSGNCGCSH